MTKDNERLDEELDEVEVEEEQDGELSLFSKYRESFLKERLRLLKIEDSEQIAAIDFINERVEKDDANLDDVIEQLKVRMRVDERLAKPSYIHQTPLSGGGRPQPRKGMSGKSLYDRVRGKKGRR